MLITVLTPTYNRAKLLERLYQSLCQQTYQDFEWIVVNDGSKDNTDEVVQSFVAEKKINILYIKQENGGKHRAVNRGVKEAKGELLFIADSDDWLLPNSLERVAEMYQDIANDHSFAGVCGLDVYADGTVIGGGMPQDVIDCNAIDIRMIHHVGGDLKEVFKTDVLREIPFPEIEGESFCPEVAVWNRIAKKYKLRYFNKPIYMVEYQPEGITSNITKARMKSPIASTTCYQEMMEFDIPLKTKIRSAINYWRFRSCGSPHKFPPLPLKWLWTMPIGWVMHLNDLRKL